MKLEELRDIEAQAASKLAEGMKRRGTSSTEPLSSTEPSDRPLVDVSCGAPSRLSPTMSPPGSPSQFEAAYLYLEQNLHVNPCRLEKVQSSEPTSYHFDIRSEDEFVTPCRYSWLLPSHLDDLQRGGVIGTIFRNPATEVVKRVSYP